MVAPAAGAGPWRSALVTDLYELNMAASYLRRGMTERATFSLFVRKLPASRGFLVAAGLEDCLSFLEAFAFDRADLDYLGEVGFDEATLDAFAALRFTGDVWAVPEGTVVFADEPMVEVTAPIAEAQLVETFLLNQVTFQTALATKAARCRVAAGDRIRLVDFALRRTHGAEAGMAVARVSAMVGFAATSNVAAARRFGLRPAGTMAHSFVEAFPTERDAFRAFAEDFPARTTFLVDTYDTLDGVRCAIEVIRALGLTEHLGVRLDSGDVDDLARRARRLLDDAGLPEVSIFASGGLDEFDLHRFVQTGTPIDAAGIGTRLGVSADAPALDSAYKLVAYGERPVRKLSEGKATLPGAKQVFRRWPITDDVVGLRDDPVPDGYVPLLEPVMTNGKRTAPSTELAAARARFERDVAALPGEALELARPSPPPVAFTPRLLALADRVERDLRRRVAAGR